MSVPIIMNMEVLAIVAPKTAKARQFGRVLHPFGWRFYVCPMLNVALGQLVAN